MMILTLSLCNFTYPSINNFSLKQNQRYMENLPPKAGVITKINEYYHCNGLNQNEEQVSISFTCVFSPHFSFYSQGFHILSLSPLCNLKNRNSRLLLLI